MRVLVAEDGAILGDLMASRLRREFPIVDVVRDAAAVLEHIENDIYDVLVLGRYLQEAAVLCREVSRIGPQIRILRLTAGTAQARVRGLDEGADDCLDHPFAFDELVARVGALGRRPAGPGRRGPR